MLGFFVGELKEHANGVSDIRVGAWWTISLGVITPIILGYMMFDLLKQNLTRAFDTPTGNYEGYSDLFILYGGWAVAGAALVIGILISVMKWKKSTNTNEEQMKEAK